MYHRKRKHPVWRAVSLLLLLLLVSTALKQPQLRRGVELMVNRRPHFSEGSASGAGGIPQELLDLMERNPETEDFVRNYPQEYGKSHEIDMGSYRASPRVPLFLQWDPQWGYLDYGNSIVGLSGCGPICLAMAGGYVTGDYDTFRPDRVVEFALENGYRVPGNGTSWSLISEGGVKLGLDVTEIPLDRERMIRNLEVDNPIICIMGPGVFTSDGHYIVVSGYEDGKFVINDPNSRERSEKRWEYEEFEDQIRNLWVIR